MKHAILIGSAVLCLAQLGISINVVTTKFLLDTMPMFMVLSCRFFVSTVLLGLLLKFSGTPFADPHHPQKKLTKQDWVLTILEGICGAFLFNLFFAWGLQHTTATAAGIVGSTLPAIIAICAAWMLKEQLQTAKIVGLVIAMLGILIINIDHIGGESTNAGHSFFGDLLVFVAMFPEAWYSIIRRKLAHRVTALGSAFLANLVGFVTLFPCALITGTFEFRMLEGWEAGLIAIAGSSALIFFWGWGWGLRFIPASTAAIFGGIMPLGTTILAVLFLGEIIHWYDAIGMLLVLISIPIGTGIGISLRKARATAN